MLSDFKFNFTWVVQVSTADEVKLPAPKAAMVNLEQVKSHMATE